jgi:hypothetical protein
MKHYKIDMRGKFFNQQVADASALVWQASDEGRTVYDQTTEAIWVADSSQWKQSGGGDVPSATAMWFYQNSAPTGWTIIATTQDTLLAVKYGAGTYTTGGSVQGAWSNLEHSHGAGTLVGGTHNHQWYSYAGSESNTYQADGSTLLVVNTNGVSATKGILSRVTHADSWRWDQESYTKNATPSLSGSTAASTTLTAARPAAHVGIICTKD